ncbi:Competence-associated EpuA protein [Streptococcus sp. DD10]|uniref:DNA-directed RNA polymerase subunit beta n=1 Tax=Streptococcus sp. DD10 TaxID=1777878 RepID=UPI00079596F7|nr:DNA-directed RNA polymerase subunit beta [Streptococcus sp. DD10]KXT76416.1 Competence-associated EpuA protein [Streptococcus sp. DD10]
MTDRLRFVGKQLGILFLILLIAMVIFFAGLMIGYSVIGSHSNPWEIFSPSTWGQVFKKLTGN